MSRGVDTLLNFKIKLVPLLLAVAFTSLGVDLAWAADTDLRIASVISSEPGPANVTGEAPAHGLSQKAQEIVRIFNFSITNSMVVTWLVSLGLIVFANVATWTMKPVPEGLQNFFEWLVESLYGFLEGIIGPHLVKRTFWFFATIFIFILSTNWLGLVP